MRRPLQHLPVALWPPQVIACSTPPNTPGEIFDSTSGARQHLSAATRSSVRFASRRSRFPGSVSSGRAAHFREFTAGKSPRAIARSSTRKSFQALAAGTVATADWVNRYDCATRRAKGTCENSSPFSRRELEIRILGGVKSRLPTPDIVHAFFEAFEKEARTAAAEREQTRELHRATSIQSTQDKRARLRDRERWLQFRAR
jgi:hypothetical protein